MASTSHRSDASKSRVSSRIQTSIRHKSCPICLNPIKPERAAVISICNHAFCVDCIQKWSDLKRTCPLCNSTFDRWLFNIHRSIPSVRRLPPPKKKRSFPRRPSLPRRSDRRRRNHQIPWRRSFGRSKDPAEIVARRALQWRSSIYRQRLRAVPLDRRFMVSHGAIDEGSRERLRARVRPWIERELKAVLGDLDPTVIVHLATSLWISSVEETTGGRELGGRCFWGKLRPFLHEDAEVFWHELRCFGECCFNMETYDCVVEYTSLGSC